MKIILVAQLSTYYSVDLDRITFRLKSILVEGLINQYMSKGKKA